MSELDRVRELLAFHAQGVLNGDDLVFVNQWLERNERADPKITAEAAWLRTTSVQLQTQVEVQTRLESETSEAGLKALMERIALEHENKTQALLDGAALQAQPDGRTYPHTIRGATVTSGSRIMRWLNEVTAIRSHVFALGLVAVVIGQASVIGMLLAAAPASQTPLSAAPVSAAVPPDQRMLTVAFRPHATELAIRAALANSSAQIIAGPSALGLYTVAVPRANADMLEAQLRAAVDVVESVQR